MEEIVLESVRLIAADQVSELVISQLRSEHIYSLENSSYVLMNMVLVSSKMVFRILRMYLPIIRKLSGLLQF